MILHKFLLGMLMLVIIAVRPVWAEKPTYAMDVQEHLNRKTSTSTCKQRVYERRTGKSIWLRHFPGYGNITWSKDHRAVVFETGPSEQERRRHLFDIKLVTWEAGGCVQAFFTRPPVHDDYTENFFWSPDKKHLLFRTGSSGASDRDLGHLYCLNVLTHRVLLVNTATRRVQWAGNRRVKYWPINFAHGSYSSSEPYEYSKPRLWHLPDGF